MTALPDFERWPLRDALRHRAVLVRDGSGPAALCADRDADTLLLEAAEARLAQPLTWRRCETAALDAWLAEAEGQGRALSGLPGTSAVAEAAEDGGGQPELSLAGLADGSSPAVRLLDAVIYDALKDGASDIHIERDALGAEVRVRLDGVMQPLQRVQGAGLEVVVDYAHTPDALDKVLHALRPLAAARGGRLWCVFGCGGNRDASKRPLMGAVAACGADHLVLTSDNPRHELPELILAQIAAGCSGVGGHVKGQGQGQGQVVVDVIADRREAIAHAVARAAAGDVVLLAGKGHEDYQDVAGVKRPFSDLVEARHALARRAEQHA